MVVARGLKILDDVLSFFLNVVEVRSLKLDRVFFKTRTHYSDEYL